jgi:hypothetical protein
MYDSEVTFSNGMVVKLSHDMATRTLSASQRNYTGRIFIQAMQQSGTW